MPPEIIETDVRIDAPDYVEEWCRKFPVDEYGNIYLECLEKNIRIEDHWQGYLQDCIDDMHEYKDCKITMLSRIINTDTNKTVRTMLLSNFGDRKDAIISLPSTSKKWFLFFVMDTDTIKKHDKR